MIYKEGYGIQIQREEIKREKDSTSIQCGG